MRFRLGSLRRLGAGIALLAGAAAAARANTAIDPVPRDPKWVARHEGFVQIAKKGGVDVLFLGDSITDNWRNRGQAVWDKYYGNLHAANFGISGDRTQHVLWRMDHGELDGIHPKVVVLMIGTNNTGLERDHPVARNTVAEAIAGVTAVVQELRAKLPDAKILLLGIFPRADTVAPKPADIREINAAIAKLDDGQSIRYLDLGPRFLNPDGTLVADDFGPDHLHPGPKGYEVWAEAIQEPLAQLLK
jgi:lysophospholipase L1-like esterase